MANAGAWSEVKAVTPQIQKICDQIKPDAEKDAGRKFPVFTAICYKEQIVSGRNYAIMLYVGDKKYAELKVFEPLSDKEQLQFIEIKCIPNPLPTEKL